MSYVYYLKRWGMQLAIPPDGMDRRPRGYPGLSYLPITMTWKVSGNTGGRGALWPSLAAGAGP